MPRLMEETMTFSALARACLVYLSANLGRSERTIGDYESIYGSFRAPTGMGRARHHCR